MLRRCRNPVRMNPMTHSAGPVRRAVGPLFGPMISSRTAARLWSWTTVAVALAALALSGCADRRPLNSPYPDQDPTANILYSHFTERPNHLDPARAYSSNEYAIIGQIYEPPLQYHYLKRPYELEPLTAREMPEPVYLDAAGRELPGDAPSEQVAFSVYEVRIRPGIRYQPHPAFARGADGELLYHSLTSAQVAGVDRPFDLPVLGTRELVAADYVYQIKRLAHPRVSSPIFSLMSEYIVGLREYGATLHQAFREAQGRGETFLDLREFPLEGAEAVDRYTYRITVRGKYPQLRYWLAMPFFAPMPWEADRFYSQPLLQERNITLDWFPVGTGAYMMTTNNPNQRMVLERNPNFHEDYYPSEGEPGDREAGLLADAGKRLPFIDKVIYSLEKETIPYWNKFLQGYYDVSGIASDSFDQAIQFGVEGDPELTPAMREKDISLSTDVAPSTYYMGFNMLDPVVGGYTDRARKLRRAISIAVDYGEYISIFLNGRGIAAQGPIPPGIFGYQEGEAGINRYVYRWEDGEVRRRSLDEARRLLAEAGYPQGRDAETGRPLTIHLDVAGGGPEDKALFDWYRKQFRKLDVDLQVRATDYNRFQDKMRKGNAQLFIWGWNADYPDPENFLFLLYGPNGKVEHGGENAANYDNAEFDRLFDRMKNMPNSPQRLAVVQRMVDIARRDAPWMWGLHPRQFVLYHAWYYNAKPNQMAHNSLKYKRIDPMLRLQKRQEWNEPDFTPLWVVLAALVAFLVPAFVVYRRKERQPIAAGWRPAER